MNNNEIGGTTHKDIKIHEHGGEPQEGLQEAQRRAAAAAQGAGGRGVPWDS